MFFTGTPNISEAVTERLAQLLDAGDLGKEPQLDLRIIGGDELHAAVGNEGATDLAAVLGTNRDVLQIGFR
jgi:hypothetical protein